jgi:hypothetical protein
LKWITNVHHIPLTRWFARITVNGVPVGTQTA